MKAIKLNHSYRGVKGLLLALIVMMGSQVGNVVFEAEEYFDLVKGLVCTLIFFGSIVLYVYIERKNEDEEDEDWEPPDSIEENE